MEKCVKRFTKIIGAVLAVISLSHASAVAVSCDIEAPTDGRGVYIEDTDRYYSCRYLQEHLKEDQVGIFRSRIDHCKKPTTDCCATCSLISLGNSNQNRGIRIGEINFECKYLLLDNPENSRLGIYKNREHLCSQDEIKTNCRETCQKVASELEKDTNPDSNTPAPETAQTTTLPRQHTTNAKEKEPKEPKELKDQCENSCLHIADGTMGKCEWLVDPERPEYNMRIFICKNKFAVGCKKTCGDILKEFLSN